MKISNIETNREGKIKYRELSRRVLYNSTFEHLTIVIKGCNRLSSENVELLVD